jgi:hypothetical protein
LLVDFLDGLVAGGHDHVLQHLHVARDFGIDLDASRFLWPSILTVTMPPPAVASTLISAISCCQLLLHLLAWRIICCMLPGSFTLRLLEIANFADFAAEHFLEALDFGVGQGAAGGLIFAGGRRELDGGGSGRLPRRRR